jgi:O-antigen/teichoic acid export membrane protein
LSKSERKDPDLYFQTDHLKANLKGKSVRGGAITVIGQVSKFSLRMVSLIILARLLAPEDYGLIGMVTVVLGFVNLFKDLGLSVATVQAPELNHRQVSTMFWINMAISVAIMLVTIALAPAIAWFYKEPRLIEITLVLAIGFIFGGLSVQHQALLRRQMRFKDLAIIEIVSMFLGVIAAIVSAWYGAAYWSLVILQLIGQVTTAAGVWLLCGWRPGLPIRGSGIRPMLAIGGNYTGFMILNYLSTNLDNVLIGSSLGAVPLGLYNRAYQLLLMPLQQISIPIKNVAIPTLSHLQTDIERYCSYYQKALLLMTTFAMPLVAFTFVSADQLILVMMGEKWLDIVPIFRVLSVAAFLNTFSMASGWAFISFGRTDRQFHWSIIASVLTTLSFLIGIRWGAIGVAAGFSISRLIIQPAEIVYCYRGLPLRFRDLAITLSRPITASIGAGVALFGLHQGRHISIDGGLIDLLIDTLLYCLLYLGIWMLLPSGKQTIWEILQLLKEFRRKPKNVKSGTS